MIDKNINVLIIGSGGREHALAWKVAQSKKCGKIFIAPGNAGTELLGENLPIKVEDFEKLSKAIIDNKIDFVIVGPDDPLGNGIVDYFHSKPELKSIPVLGPTAQGAKLEASKSFAKEFMLRHNIPTAAYASFTIEDKEAALKYVENHALPLVMKADGLAAGKGVSICNVHSEALQFIKDVWERNKFGNAGSRIVIEEFLEGIELSVFILTDGKKYVLLPEAKDYKRVGEGDTGPNTGGMGAISPVPFADEEFMQKVKDRIIEPTIAGLQKDGIDYKGFIFIGLISVFGEPFVIEYNARMGDPETQVVMPRIKDDILPYFYQAAQGKLKNTNIDFSDDYAAAIIAVSGGYPDQYNTGFNISGLDKATDVEIFMAGVKNSDDALLTSGGRVFALVAQNESLDLAINNAYRELLKVHFPNMYYRKDIGKDLLEADSLIQKN